MFFVVPQGFVQRRPADQLVRRSAAATRTAPRTIDFSSAKKEGWIFPESCFNGTMTHDRDKRPDIEQRQDSIQSGLMLLKSHPEVYEAMYFQSNPPLPEGNQCYTLVKRTHSGFSVANSPPGPFTIVQAKYQALPAEVHPEPDMYTDRFFFMEPHDWQNLGRTSEMERERYGIMNYRLKAVSPGRGHGIADLPEIKIIGDADPCDVVQGTVGDCWLLSAISALAEYDGAIAHLFRHTNNLNKPLPGWNKYVVTLWDIPSRREVDIEIDERLCMTSDGRNLVGCKPSADGELWVCYLEKAVAAHCGGWNKIHGGYPSHAFRLLLGCWDQYYIKQKPNGLWDLFKSKPAPQHAGDNTNNEAHHPELQNQNHDWLFTQLLHFHNHNCIMCCATERRSGSHNNNLEGICDCHAYTILDVRHFDASRGLARHPNGLHLIKIRNPHGKGEFQTGDWDDDGPMWKEYPALEAELERVEADDGVFWMEMHEFVRHFSTVFLTQKDLKEFLDPNSSTNAHH